jgi:hypothetical protein
MRLTVMDANANHRSESQKLPFNYRSFLGNVSEGVVLLYLTVLCYMCAYTFKVGYFYNYSLPLEMISVDKEDCLKAGFHLMIGVLGIGVSGLAALHIYKHGGWRQSKSLCAIFLIYPCTTAGTVAHFILPFGTLIWSIVGLYWLLLVAIILKGTEDEARERIDEVMKLHEEPLKVFEHTSIEVRLILGSSSLALIFLFYGFTTGYKERNYHFIKDSNEAVIMKLDEGYLFKSYDFKEEIWLPEVTVRGQDFLDGKELVRVNFEYKPSHTETLHSATFKKPAPPTVPAVSTEPSPATDPAASPPPTAPPLPKNSAIPPVSSELSE